METGFADADSRDDFSKARRAAGWSRIGGRLRGRPGDLDMMLPFDEVVAALGRRGERQLGEKDIALSSIVGSVDRRVGFDRQFRPTSNLARTRFERIAKALRRGEDVPSIQVYRVGEAHFVIDGHHRVAVYRALGRTHIGAWVTEILTQVGAGTDLTLADLPEKGHQRLFRERVPLSPERHAMIELHRAEDWGGLAEGVEAWGYRFCSDRGELLNRRDIARAWFDEEYLPTLALLRAAGLLHDGERDSSTDTESYLDLAEARYRLLRAQRWDPPVVDRLRDALQQQ